jgi:Kef-type K+ transport system membrane component KefB
MRRQRLRPRLAAGFALAAVVALFAFGAPTLLSGPEARAAAADVKAGHGGDKAAGKGHEGESHAGGHVDVFTAFLFGLGFVVVLAMVGRWLAGLCHQPAVLGELLIGVLAGNVGYWLGLSGFVLVMQLGDAQPVFNKVFAENKSVQEAAKETFPPEQLKEGGRGDRVVKLLTGKDSGVHVTLGFGLWLASNLGVVLLLFLVGVESSIEGILKVGVKALLVACVGVVVPFALGYLASFWLLPGESEATHLFIAAAFCATSVGITARVFKDLGLLQGKTAQIILGAAVIDDVLGLIILAVVSGIAASGGVQMSEVVRITLLSAAFLGFVMILGERLVGRLVPVMRYLDRHHVKLLFPLALAFFMAWLASQIQLASIVGAFAAGLILSEKLFATDKEHATMEESVAPLEKLFAPVFFVLTGMQVNLASFLEPGIAGLALVLTVIAIVGKVVAGLVAGKDVDRLSVGVGMVPRGEVGLIFAAVGRSIGVIGDTLFAAVVIVLMATTLVTPPALKWSLSRARQEPGPQTERAGEATAAGSS